jgi:hypothetical protein
MVSQQMVPGADLRDTHGGSTCWHIIGAAGVWTLTANIRPARQPAAGEKEVHAGCD